MKNYIVNKRRLTVGALLCCISLLIAFESIQAISVKNGYLVLEQRHLWSLVKSSKSIPVSEIASVDVLASPPSRGSGMKKVVICCRNGERIKFGGGRSLGNLAFEIKKLLNDSIDKGRDLEEITVFEYTIMFGVAIIIGIFTLLVSLRKVESTGTESTGTAAKSMKRGK